MKSILLGYVLLLMVVSCVGQQKRSESLSDEQGIELLQTDSVSISDEELSDTLIVVSIFFIISLPMRNSSILVFFFRYLSMMIPQ